MSRCKFSDISGQRFGRLLVLHPTEQHVTSETKFTCQCDCGKVKDIVGRSMTKGLTTSCGCYRSERAREATTTHGATKEGAERWVKDAYAVHQTMLARCYGSDKVKATKWYRDRGIKVCDRWLDFEMFLHDMYPKPGAGMSIERLDVNGDYGPDNCVWADALTQANNRSNNTMLCAFGKEQTGTQWAREYGVNYRTIRTRLARGWGVEEAIATPISKPGQYRVLFLTIGTDTKTIYEWADISGIAVPTIRIRVKKGEPTEQAVFRPLYSK